MAEMFQVHIIEHGSEIFEQRLAKQEVPVPTATSAPAPAAASGGDKESNDDPQLIKVELSTLFCYVFNT
jgi:hypothetical protein